MCILQETHLLGSRILSLKNVRVGGHYHSTFLTMLGGVSVLVHETLPFQLIEVKTGPAGRYVILHALIAEIAFVILALYLPLSAEFHLLYMLMQIIAQFGIDNVLILGHLNLVPCPDLDRLCSTSRWSPGLA